MIKGIAVIGGGISGISFCLNFEKVEKNDNPVTLFERLSTTGGRLFTNKIGKFAFDIGAQYIDASEGEFHKYLQQWINEGLIKQWQARFGRLNGSTYKDIFSNEIILVPVPSMDALPQKLASKLNITEIKLNCKIDKIFKKFNEWYLQDDKNQVYGPYSTLILAVSSGAALELVKDYPYLVEVLKKVVCRPRFVFQVAFDSPINFKYDALFLENSNIRWMARNNSKPDRGATECWVIHANKDWTEANYREDELFIENELMKEFNQLTNNKTKPVFQKISLWKNGIVEQPLNQNFIFDNNRNFALIGDFCLGKNIEASYLSGKLLAEKISQSMA